MSTPSSTNVREIASERDEPPLSYYHAKLAALAAGRPWPPPREDEEPPVGPHAWTQRTVREAPLWRCERCPATSLEIKPSPGTCRGRRS